MKGYEEIINDRLYLIKLDKWALKVKDLIKYYDTSERQFQRKFVRRFAKTLINYHENSCGRLPSKIWGF